MEKITNHPRMQGIKKNIKLYRHDFVAVLNNIPKHLLSLNKFRSIIRTYICPVYGPGIYNVGYTEHGHKGMISFAKIEISEDGEVGIIRIISS